MRQDVVWATSERWFKMEQPVKKNNGAAIAALVFGILAILSGIFFPLAILFGVIAIICGVIGKKKGAGGVAIGGIVTGAIGLLIGLAVLGFTIFVGQAILDGADQLGREWDLMMEEVNDTWQEDMQRMIDELEALNDDIQEWGVDVHDFNEDVMESFDEHFLDDDLEPTDMVPTPRR
jgi:hypothetical protein